MNSTSIYAQFWRYTAPTVAAHGGFQDQLDGQSGPQKEEQSTNVAVV